MFANLVFTIDKNKKLNWRNKMNIQEQEERDYFPQSDYQLMRAGAGWAEPEEQYCGCKGSGWYISNFDTVERCPYHRATKVMTEES